MPDASLVAKWHTATESGWEQAQLFLASFTAGSLRLTAPEHLKVEVIRVLQMGVRDKRYTIEEGLQQVEAFQTLPIAYVSNDLLFHDAFRMSSIYQLSLYDTLYIALAQALEIPFITADRRTINLSTQRGIALVRWFEDVAPAG